MKTYYKARIGYQHEGTAITFEEYISVHETNGYAWCLPKWHHEQLCNTVIYTRKPDESPLQQAKRIWPKFLKRVSKGNSRFAFSTKEEAFKQLKFLKQRQLRHLQRDLDLLTDSLNKLGDKPLDSLLTEQNKTPDYLNQDSFVIPDTAGLVNRYFAFD